MTAFNVAELAAFLRVDGVDAATRDLLRVDQQGQRAARSLGSFRDVTGTVTRALGAMGGVLGGLQLAAFAKDLYQLGVSGAETASKFQTTFGAASAGVEAFLQGFGPMAGLSRNAAREVSATMGAIVQGMGMGKDASAGFSQQILSLAGDLTSFSDVPIEETLAAIRSGLVGEAEPMKRFGIVLLDAETKTRALAMSGKVNAAQLTQQELALARFQLMLQKAGPAMGDLARTQDSAANQARQLGARWENLKTDLADGLLPVFAATIGALSSIVRWIGDHGPLLEGIAATTLAVGTLTLGMQGFTAATVALTKAGGLRAALAGLSAAALNPIGLAIAGIGVAIGALVWYTQHAKRENEQLRASFASTAESLGTTQRLTAEYRALATAIETGRVKGEALAQTKARLKDVTEKLTAVSPAYAAALETEHRTARETADAIDAVTRKRWDDVKAQAAQLEAALAQQSAAVAGATSQAAIMGMAGPRQAAEQGLAQARTNLEAFYRQFPQLDPRQPPMVPGVVVTKPEASTKAAPVQLASTEVDAARAAAQRTLALTLEKNRAAQAENDRAYAQGTVSLAAYHTTRLRLIGDASTAELRALRAEYAAVAQLQTTTAEGAPDKAAELQKARQLAELDGRIAAQKVRSREEDAAGTEARRVAERQLAEEVLAARQQQLTLEGQQRAAAELGIQRQLADYETLLAREGVGEAERQARSAARAQALRTEADAAAVARQAAQLDLQLALDREGVEAQVAQHVLSEEDGALLINRLTASRVEDMLRVAAGYAAASAGAADQARAEELLAEAIRRRRQAEGAAAAPQTEEQATQVQQQTAFDELGKQNKAAASSAGLQLGMSLATGFGDAIDAGFTAIGQGKGLGAGLKAMAASMLGTLGGAIKEFGKKALVAGIMMSGLMKAFKSLQPPAMIAAAVGLIALGSLLQGAAQSAFGDGGGGGGGASASVGAGGRGAYGGSASGGAPLTYTIGESRPPTSGRYAVPALNESDVWRATVAPMPRQGSALAPIAAGSGTPAPAMQPVTVNHFSLGSLSPTQKREFADMYVDVARNDSRLPSTGRR